MPQSCSTLKARSMQKSQQHVPPSFSTFKAQVLSEKVQQAPMNSSTIVSQVSEKQLQHVPRESPTVEAHDIQDQVQQETQNSEENDLSGELGPVTENKKRGSTVMQSVHRRQKRKLVILNRYNQPIGPTNTVVTELGSFLGTLARNAMLCPLNIHNWKNMDTKKDCWDYTQEKYDIPDSAKNGLWVELKMLGESIRMTCIRIILKHMTMMIFEWKISPKMFQNLILRIFSNIGTLKNSRK